MTRVVLLALALVVGGAGTVMEGSVWVTSKPFVTFAISQSIPPVGGETGPTISSARSTSDDGGNSLSQPTSKSATLSSFASSARLSPPTEREADAPTHGLYVWSLTEPALDVPLDFAEGISQIVECEIREYIGVEYLDWGSIISPTQDYGQFAINRIHADGMARNFGMDFWSELDRVQFGVMLYGWFGWSKWNCSADK